MCPPEVSLGCIALARSWHTYGMPEFVKA